MTTTTPPPLSKTIPVGDGSGLSVEKTDEALGGGPFGGLLTPGTVVALTRWNDEQQRLYGEKVYDKIDQDAVAGSSVDSLIYTTLANEMKFVPRHQPEPGKDAETPEEQEKFDTSQKVTDWVTHTIDNLRIPLSVTAKMQMRGALGKGADVADKVWEIEPDEDGNNQIVLKAIKPKERVAWTMEVDPFCNLLYIRGGGILGMGYQRWPREKFMVLTWGGKGCDPRGESVYQRAVEAWNFRVQVPEDHFRFLKRFGTPKVVGKLSPASMRGGRDGQTGQLPSQNPFAWFIAQIAAWINGSALTVGKDDTVEVHEVKSEGQAFVAARDHYAREIIQAILLQTRATAEAQHGSKADSQTGQDVMGNLVRHLRRWYCEQFEADVIYPIVAYRFGHDIARKYSPGASLGDVEHQDVAALMTALASLGYAVQGSQFPAIDAMVSLPVRKADEVETGPTDSDTGGGQDEDGTDQKEIEKDEEKQVKDWGKKAA